MEIQVYLRTEWSIKWMKIQVHIGTSSLPWNLMKSWVNGDTSLP